MTPKLKNPKPITETEKVLNEAIKKSNSGRFLGWLKLLWPNVPSMLLRLSEHLGSQGESVQLAELTKALQCARENVMDAKPDKLEMTGRDRMILMLFLQGLLQPFEGESKPKPEETVVFGLQVVEGGALRVILKNGEGIPYIGHKAQQEPPLLGHILSQKDRLILGQDLDVLAQSLKA